MAMNLYCPKCGYDLRGGEDESAKVLRCPECGMEHSRGNVEAFQRGALDQRAWLLPQLLFMPLVFAILFCPSSCVGMAIWQDYTSAGWIVIGFLPLAGLSIWFAYTRAKVYHRHLLATGRLTDSPWIVQSFPACWVMFSLVEMFLTVTYIGGCMFALSQG